MEQSGLLSQFPTHKKTNISQLFLVTAILLFMIVMPSAGLVEHLNLSPKFAQKRFEGEGGAYYSWSSSEYELLRKAKVGGGDLVLEPGGFTLPHYSDYSKIGYVLEGSGIVGVVSPTVFQEVVLRVKPGDIIALLAVVISWWYNDGNINLVAIFVGETSTAYVPGEFTHFLLAGIHGILGGFSTEFTARAYRINNKEAEDLAKGQSGVMIIRLPDDRKMPRPSKKSTSTIDKLVYNLDAALPDVRVQNAGLLISLTEKKLPFTGEVGLSAALVKLDAGAMSSLAMDSSDRVIYVAKGGGRIQVVSMNGERVLDAELKADHLCVVPRFFVASIVADGDQGMEYLSMTKTTESLRVFGEFSGKTWVWGVLSPQVLQASLNVTPELEQVFREKSTILVPTRD